MKLEDYFEFLNPDDIRIKGHRVGIDNILKYHLEGCTPEEILEHFPSLDFEKIYATLTYYYHYKEEIDTYLERLKQWQKQHYQEELSNPSSMRKRIQKIIQERSKKID